MVFAVAHATDDWFNVSLATFGKVEVNSSSQVVLEQPYPNWGNTTSVTSLNGSCQAMRIVLVPPSGNLSIWTSLVLTGQSVGRSLWVYGSCSSNVITTAASPNNRIMLE